MAEQLHDSGATIDLDSGMPAQMAAKRPDSDAPEKESGKVLERATAGAHDSIQEIRLMPTTKGEGEGVQFRIFVAKESTRSVLHLLRHAAGGLQDGEKLASRKEETVLALAKGTTDAVCALPGAQTMPVDELTQTIQDMAQRLVSARFHGISSDRHR